MSMQVLTGVALAVKRRLVKTHRIGERDFKQIVVAHSYLMDDVG